MGIQCAGPIMKSEGGPWLLIGSANTTQDPTGAAIDMIRPGSIQIGDLMFVSYMGVSSSNPGWNNTNNGNVKQYWRVATGGGGDQFNWALGTESDEGRVGMFVVFRNQDIVSIALIKQSPIRQRLNLDAFVVAEIVDTTPEITDSLIVTGCQRNGVDLEDVPSGAIGFILPEGDWILIGSAFKDWSAFGTRWSHVAMAYVNEPSSLVTQVETDYAQDQWEVTIGPTGSTARTYRFNE